MIRERAVDAIVEERHRQERLKADGKFPWTCADTHHRGELILNHEKLSVLLEEVGEVARAINDGDGPNMRDELTQVAACCVAWLESL